MAVCQATRGQANSPWSKEDLVDALLTSKERSGKTFAQIAAEIGCTNVYTASLFYHQQQLKSETSVRLQRAVPTLTPQLIEAMMQPPKRRQVFPSSPLPRMHTPHIDPTLLRSKPPTPFPPSAAPILIQPHGPTSLLPGSLQV